MGKTQACLLNHLTLCLLLMWYAFFLPIFSPFRECDNALFSIDTSGYSSQQKLKISTVMKIIS